MKYGEIIARLEADAASRTKKVGIEYVEKLPSDAKEEVRLCCAEISAAQALQYLWERDIDDVETLAKEMKRFDQLKKHEMQYLDNMEDPLEPLKISSALDSEILKFEYRKKHDPKSISILDYTIIAALVEALEKRTGNCLHPETINPAYM